MGPAAKRLQSEFPPCFRCVARKGRADGLRCVDRSPAVGLEDQEGGEGVDWRWVGWCSICMRKGWVERSGQVAEIRKLGVGVRLFLHSRATRAEKGTPTSTSYFLPARSSPLATSLSLASRGRETPSSSAPARPSQRPRHERRAEPCACSGLAKSEELIASSKGGSVFRGKGYLARAVRKTSVREGGLGVSAAF